MLKRVAGINRLSLDAILTTEFQTASGSGGLNQGLIPFKGLINCVMINCKVSSSGDLSLCVCVCVCVCVLNLF